MKYAFKAKNKDTNINKFSINEIIKNEKNNGLFLEFALEFDDHRILWFIKSFIDVMALVFTCELGSM